MQLYTFIGAKEKKHSQALFNTVCHFRNANIVGVQPHQYSLSVNIRSLSVITSDLPLHLVKRITTLLNVIT